MLFFSLSLNSSDNFFEKFFSIFGRKFKLLKTFISFIGKNEALPIFSFFKSSMQFRATSVFCVTISWNIPLDKVWIAASKPKGISIKFTKAPTTPFIFLSNMYLMLLLKVSLFSIALEIAFFLIFKFWSSKFILFLFFTFSECFSRKSSISFVKLEISFSLCAFSFSFFSFWNSNFSFSWINFSKFSFNFSICEKFLFFSFLDKKILFSKSSFSPAIFILSISKLEFFRVLSFNSFSIFSLLFFISKTFL